MHANWSDYEVFLKPIHLKGQAVTLTIVKATEEETHPQRGKSFISPVLWFRELPFGLILSPTNRQMLAALYGDSVADCIGKPIVVKAIKEKVAGRDKEPIRIQNVLPKAASVDTTTGEIVSPSAAFVAQTASIPVSEENAYGQDGASELDSSDQAAETPGITYPTTEALYSEWLKSNGWNGRETYQSLGTDAKTWLKKHPQLTWADVARQVEAHQAASK